MAEDIKNTQEEELMEPQQDELAEETVPEQEEGKKKKEKTSKKDEKDKQIEELGQKLLDTNDKYIRLSAEFDNYRKRTLKEKMELTKTAGEQILLKVLPVIDNFERALASMEKATDVAALEKGVELIYANFKDFLVQNGVKEIQCAGADFNTDEHEAITKIPAPAPDLKGKVVDCIEKGYVLNDKVIRFAKVVVGE